MANSNPFKAYLDPSTSTGMFGHLCVTTDKATESESESERAFP